MLKESEALHCYDALNRVRTQRALGMLTEYGRQVFHLLPVILHYHHPLLPGFVSSESRMPRGINHFLMNPIQRVYLDEIAEKNHINFDHAAVDTADILGVYTMGSTASIGQSASSDLDIWVCLRNDIEPIRCQLMKTKCDLISTWALRRGVEVNFFVIHANTFSQAHATNRLEGEGCGSALRLLLLDEFYRSTLTLAGARISWLLPHTLNTQTEYLDFGNFDHLPAEEFFGAGLWQLYKALDSPYKSLLKTLLMESYSQSYPQHPLLCRVFRQRLYKEPADSLKLDSYYMMLEYVTEYLQQQGDTKRLELVRQCFYLKISEEFKYPVEHWGNEIIQELTTSWKWSQNHLFYLNNRKHWKIRDVKKMHAQLVDALMQSYQKLISFARKHNITAAINPEDIGILSRKVFVALEKFPDKIERVNLNIAPNLGERTLCFVQAPNHASHPWALHTHEPQNIKSKSAIHRDSSLFKITAWSYFNGLLTAQSRLNVICDPHLVDKDKLPRLCHDLSNFFPTTIPVASNEALRQPCAIEQIGIFLNFGHDPTAKFKQPFTFEEQQTLSTFSYGIQQENLIGSIDVVYVNSWHEIRCLTYQSKQAVLDATLMLLSKMHAEATPPKGLNVFCYSRWGGDLMTCQFEQWLRLCFSLRYKSRHEQEMLKVIRLGGQRHCLVFNSLGVEAMPLENSAEFYRQLSANKELACESHFVFEADLLAAVNAYASQDLVQFFIQPLEQGYRIVLLDEGNQIDVFQDASTDKDTLVKNIQRIYAGKTNRPNFNLPQFYDLTYEKGQWLVRPYQTVEHAAS